MIHLINALVGGAIGLAFVFAIKALADWSVDRRDPHNRMLKQINKLQRFWEKETQR